MDRQIDSMHEGSTRDKGNAANMAFMAARFLHKMFNVSPSTQLPAWLYKLCQVRAETSINYNDRKNGHESLTDNRYRI